MNTISITFIPLSRAHFPQLAQWLNESHVKQWYEYNSLQTTIKGLENKLGPRIDRKEAIDSYIIAINTAPIGYIQVYDARKFSRDDYKLSTVEHLLEQYIHLAAIDLYIGDLTYVGKGYGSQIIQQFVHDIVRNQYEACIADPDSDNKASIRAFEKAGFKKLTEIELSNNKAIILMLIDLNIEC